MVAVELKIGTQLGVILTKPSDLVTSFTLQPGKTIPYLYICTLRVHINIILMKEKTCQENALTGTYICEISKLPDIHRYINKYETEY